MENREEWFNHILNSEWIAIGSNEIVRPVRHSDGKWEFGNINVDDEVIAAACPTTDIDNIQEFSFIHDFWKIGAFKIYRPLIYYCAFGSDAIVECTCVAIESLIEFGKWKYEIAVITNEDTCQRLQDKLTHLDLKERLHLITITADTKLDWTMARYRLDTHPIFQKAQPLLYLDTDIVCDKPLDDLFTQYINTPLFHACKEGQLGEGTPESGGYWYGWRFMQEDNVPFNPLDKGFSSGALFFCNAKTAWPYFELIIKSAYGFMTKQGYQDQFYDQRFTNYILFKLKMVEIDMMEKWIYLYRIPEGRTLTPSGHRRKGLVHFLNATTENKLITMKKYIEDLDFRSE